ncbi:hypothetical protein BDV93DRAFT_515593, partial [Ceratobasidium sp. AG-I]
GGFNVEFKAFDGVANPYLGLAAVLGAGLTGLKNQAVLEMRDCQVVASELTEDRRREMRVMAKMPTQNAVFEPGLDEKTKFINTWLPTEAWKLYKDVRSPRHGRLAVKKHRRSYKFIQLRTASSTTSPLHPAPAASSRVGTLIVQIMYYLLGY